MGVYVDQKTLVFPGLKLSHCQAVPLGHSVHGTLQPLTMVKPLWSELVVLNMNPIDRARLLAVSAPHAGDWLMALPVASCGLRLDNESIRMAVGLRLGCVLCSAHRCSCGAVVSDRGVHRLTCRLAAGSSQCNQRHHTPGAWLLWRSSRLGTERLDKL